MSLLFRVEYSRVSDKGVIVIGYAPHPETLPPKKGESVEVRNPDGSTFRAEVADVDVTFSSRSCVSQKTVNRAMLIEQDEDIKVMAGAEIRSMS